MKERYLYGMRLRGFSPGCQPKDGFVECLTETTENREAWIESRNYYDILVYDRKLSETELDQYELQPLNTLPPGQKLSLDCPDGTSFIISMGDPEHD